MTVTIPPVSPETEDERSVDERVAELEALITEARRRARRRRAAYAAVVLVILAGAVAGSIVIGDGSVNVGARVADGATASAADASPRGRWGPTRGPDGGYMSAVALDPDDPATAYVGGSGNVFKTTNAGKTWRNVTFGHNWTRVTALAVDPTRTSIVYVGTDRGVAKTTNGGRSWSTVNNGLFDGAPADVLRNGHIEGFIGAILVDPSRPSTVYLSTRNGLFRTTNGGGGWGLVGPSEFVRGSRRWSHGTAIGAGRPGTMYASWGRGDLYKSTDRGDTWQQVAIEGPHPRFGSLVVDAHRAGTLYAGGAWQRRGLWKSDDGGDTWRRLGFTKGHVNQLGLGPGTRATVFAVTDTAVYASSDAGASWRRLGFSAPLVCCIASDPHAPDTLYSGGSDGPVKSVDGGRTWRPIKSGFVSTGVEALALTRGCSETLYAGTWEGVHTSSDGGGSWRAARGAVAPTRVESLAVEQRRGGAVYAGTRGFGLFKSSDRGVTWRQVNPGLAEYITALAVDPEHPNTVYAGADPEMFYGDASNRGIYKTVNGGATWRRLALDGSVRALAIDPLDTDTLFAAANSGLFRSTDGGGNWRRVAAIGPEERQKLGIDPTGDGFHAVAIDPMNPMSVYTATIGSILKSTDGGDTWAPANAGLAKGSIDALAVDPRNPRLLYVAGDGGVFRSADGARSWHRFERGLAGPHVRSFAIVADGRTIFAGTGGQGVIAFRLPAR